MGCIASSTNMRVMQHSCDEINQQNRRKIEMNLIYYAQHTDEIDQRLGELDREWDIERILEAQAGLMACGFAFLGLASRKARIMPMIIGGFLALHAFQGWCPPVPMLRKIGVRTMYEINLERYALKALRGDFREIGGEQPGSLSGAAQALKAATVGVG